MWRRHSWEGNEGHGIGYRMSCEGGGKGGLPRATPTRSSTSQFAGFGDHRGTWSQAGRGWTIASYHKPKRVLFPPPKLILPAVSVGTYLLYGTYFPTLSVSKQFFLRFSNRNYLHHTSVLTSLSPVSCPFEIYGTHRAIPNSFPNASTCTSSTLSVV